MPLLVALFSIASAGAPAARLEGPTSPIVGSGAATFTLKAAGRIFVDGCAAVELERKQGETWVPVEAEVRCDGAATARSGDKSLVFTLAPPEPGEYRGVAAWGTGCVEGRTFALAACKQRGVARSEGFTVTPAP